MYVDRLRARCGAIDSVWLLHPPPLSSDRPEWRLLAFGDDSVLDAVRAEPEWHRRDVVLMVVTDGDRFASPWGSARGGRLSALDWRLEDAEHATFVPPASTGETRRESAVRVR